MAIREFHQPHYTDEMDICVGDDRPCVGLDPYEVREHVHALLRLLREHPDREVRERALLEPSS